MILKACKNASLIALCLVLSSITESDFTAIVDVTVEVQNSTGISEPFKIHRRTVQKP